MRTLLWAFVVFFVLPAVGCLTCMGLGSRSTPIEQRPASTSLPDLTKLLPPRAGSLELLESSASRFNFSDPRDRFIDGDYGWVDPPGVVPLAREFKRPYASLKCFGRVLTDTPVPDDCDMHGEQKVKLGAQTGCFTSQDRPSAYALGAAVSWPGCILQFKMGALDGRSKADAITAARDASAWVDQYRPK